MSEENFLPCGRSAIVISIDGVGARYLGAYGNTSLPTPGIDRMASRALLFETALAGRFSSDPVHWDWDQLSEIQDVIPGTLRLVTDCERVGQWAEVLFDEVEVVAYETALTTAASFIETNLAKFFSVALDRAMKVADGDLLVLHCRGLYSEWDAPLEYREQLRGDDDPPVPTGVTLEEERMDDVLTLDSALAWQQAYGAQLRVLDECIDLFLDEVEQVADDNLQCLICLTSPRAYPIGEHNLIGDRDACLFDDSLHVPLLIQFPGTPVGYRCQQLVYANHWIDWISHWFLNQALVVPSLLPDYEREFLICYDENEQVAIRTHRWKLIADHDKRQLYAKPDDRWEKNDVANRCPDVPQQLLDLAEPSDEAN